MSDLTRDLRSQATYLERSYGWTGNLEEAADALEAQEARIAELEACLKWFIDNDETNEGEEPMAEYGGRSWDEMNAFWLDGRNRARSALSKPQEQDKP